MLHISSLVDFFSRDPKEHAPTADTKCHAFPELVELPAGSLGGVFAEAKAVLDKFVADNKIPGGYFASVTYQDTGLFYLSFSVFLFRFPIISNFFFCFYSALGGGCG